MDQTTGKTAVITGASSGVGRAAALELARAGWNIVALGRDPGRSAEALGAIRAVARADARIEMITGDLASLSDTARMADAILAHTYRIHALCNNAGGVRDRMIVNDEGNEATFAGNHLGHFLLTKRLLPALRRAAAEGRGGRIVNVSSEGHHQAPEIDWDDLQGTRDWVSGRNYCTAKLCNLLFTHELARRYAGDGIVAHGMHPGEAATNFASHAVPEMQAYIATLEMIPPEVAGHTIAWLLSSEEAGRTSAGYFFDCREVPASPRARDPETAARLWSESEALLARSGY
jgi:NAD(P)-dependent dehydrogenase (short-subunit alcohol dehydrogenase family)